MQSLAYVLIAGLVLGFGGGYRMSNLVHSKDQADLLRLERTKLLLAEKRSAKLQNELQTANASTKIIYKTITKRIPQYVTKKQKTDSDCNVTIGTKRLLDNAFNNVSKAPENFTDTDRAASNITELDLIKHSALTAKQYNLARQQCNSLIKWYKSEYPD